MTYKNLLLNDTRQESLMGELILLIKEEQARFSDRMTSIIQGCFVVLPPAVKSAYDWPIPFSEREQNILAYYSPFTSQIKDDLDLCSRCLSAILEQNITIARAIPFEEMVEVNTWTASKGQSDMGLQWAGRRSTEAPCFHIEIGPLQAGDIAGFLPGALLRRFLELGLCPLLLPDGAKWEIYLTAVNEDFIVQDENHLCYWNINTRISL